MARKQRSTTFTQESTRPITQVALYASPSDGTRLLIGKPHPLGLLGIHAR